MEVTAQADLVSSLLQVPPEVRMNLLLALIVIMFLLALPAWPYSSAWGYYPSGGLGLVLLIVLVLALTNRRTV